MADNQAITSACRRALGVRLREGPFTPKRVLAGMQQKKT
jgi:CO/xanthine dehydrogenase Mo-binding subunit